MLARVVSMDETDPNGQLVIEMRQAQQHNGVTNMTVRVPVNGQGRYALATAASSDAVDFNERLERLIRQASQHGRSGNSTGWTPLNGHYPLR